MFGKSVPLLAIVLVCMLSIGSFAAVLEFYGTIRTTSVVEQSVVFLVDGKPRTQVTDDFAAIAGNCEILFYTLRNRASVPAKMSLETLPIEEGITVSYGYDLETFEDSKNQEKVWGAEPNDLVTLDGKLTISVSYDGPYVMFQVIVPSDYNAESSLTSFIFDIEPDGRADFQIQYAGSGSWVYSEVDTTLSPMKWFKDTEDWSEVPAMFITEQNIETRTFVLKVPIPVLGGFGSDYKFGVQTCGEPGHQTFYSTDPRHLWYDPDLKDYVHSTYYVPMTVGKALPDVFEIGGLEDLEIYILYESAVYTSGGTYSFGTVAKVVQ